MTTPNTAFYNTIARYYDAENADKTDDLVFYSELADETGGPILDVGCGTGRVMLHLAQQGCRVVGVDLSAAMLERGQRKLAVMPDLAGQVTFVQGDALDAELPDHYRLLIVPYNGLLHFITQADQIAALRRFGGLLTGDGRLVLDLPNAGEAFGTQDDGTITLERTFIEPESGHLVMQQAVSVLERISQQLYVTWIYDEIGAGGVVQRTLAPLTLRYVFPAELDLMLAAVGLQRVAVYGDYDRAPFVEGSPRMIVLARRSAER